MYYLKFLVEWAMNPMQEKSLCIHVNTCLTCMHRHICDIYDQLSNLRWHWNYICIAESHSIHDRRHSGPYAYVTSCCIRQLVALWDWGVSPSPTKMNPDGLFLTIWSCYAVSSSLTVSPPSLLSASFYFPSTCYSHLPLWLIFFPVFSFYRITTPSSLSYFSYICFLCSCIYS